MSKQVSLFIIFKEKDIKNNVCTSYIIYIHVNQEQMMV